MMNRTEYLKAKDAYISALPSMDKSAMTIRTYDLALRKYADFLKDDEQTTPLSVVKWRTALFDSGIKPNTIRQYSLCLHGFFDWCIRMNLTRENPVKIEEIPREIDRTYDLLNLSEIETLLAARPPVSRKTMFRNYTITVMLILTGLRNQELRMLTPKDLDFERGTILVSRESAKGSKERQAAFPRQVQEVVKTYLEQIRPQELSDDDYLFGSYADDEGGTSKSTEWHALASTSLTRLVKNWVRKRTGHLNIGSHDLRHAYASYAAEKGVPLRALSLSMGHASERTTSKIYISILDKSSAAQTVNSYFG